MGVDTFICGVCRDTFHSIDQFVQHKNDGCVAQGSSGSTQADAATISQGSAAAFVPELKSTVSTVPASIKAEESHDNQGADHQTRLAPDAAVMDVTEPNPVTMASPVEAANSSGIESGLVVYERKQDDQPGEDGVRSHFKEELAANTIQLVHLEDLGEDSSLLLQQVEVQQQQQQQEQQQQQQQQQEDEGQEVVQTIHLQNADGRFVEVQVQGPLAVLQGQGALLQKIAQQHLDEGGEGGQLLRVQQIPGVPMGHSQIDELGEQPGETPWNGDELNLHFPDVPAEGQGVNSSENVITNLQIIIKSSAEMVGDQVVETSAGGIVAVTQQKPGKRRGRPRKGEEKAKEPKAPPKPTLVKEAEKSVMPERASDGKLRCPRCKKTFGRERHFTTHKCLAVSDYVDITKRELLEDVEIDSGGEDENRDVDTTADFRLPHLAKKTRGPRGPYSKRQQHKQPKQNQFGIKEIKVKQSQAAEDEAKVEQGVLITEGGGGGGEGDQVHHHPTLSTALEAMDPALLPPIDVHAGGVVVVAAAALDADQHQQVSADKENAADKRGGKYKLITDPFAADVPSLKQIKVLPVFLSEEEKVAFEQRLNVDLSALVDHMFKGHVIEQNVNDHAPPPTGRTSSELNVYSCDVCQKVFMSLSHVRLHCLIHTDLKPFQCIKCDYASNTKGNMYTHMRHHTGQMYKCSKCAFRTVNRGHLLEHESTHSNQRFKCELCRHDYNTVKSLINHIRKYHHQTRAGMEYLAKFQNRQNTGPAVLHQCHICNRKFKKKVDRDRHLFVHNIKNNPNVWACELCDYACSRRVYLGRHMRRHRIVYVCRECSMKFTSTARLNQHLTDTHLSGELSDDVWQEALQACINCSLYLPEADGTLADLGKNPAESPDKHNHDATKLDAQSAELDRVTDDSEQAVEVEEEEEEDQEEVVDGATEGDGEEAPGQVDPKDMLKTMGFKPLTVDIFQQLRQLYGHEECEFCGRLFMARNDVDLHFRTHTGEKPFACDQCDYRAITKENLKRHIEKEHDKVKFACMVCQFVGNSYAQLYAHTQKHRQPTTVTCPKCPTTFNTMKRLRIHLQIQHREMDADEVRMATSTSTRVRNRIGKKTYRCQYCVRCVFKSAPDLQKHIWIHEGVKPFKCPLCPYACRSKNNLQAHMIRHSSDKPFLCTHCGKAYKSKTALRWHVRSHKEGTFKCNRCTYEATQKSHLKRHMETHDVIKRYVCQHCSYSANTVGYMKIHYTRNHKGHQYNLSAQAATNPAYSSSTATNPAVSAANVKVYRCLSCDYLFGNFSDMKRHLKVRHHIQLEDMGLQPGAVPGSVRDSVRESMRSGEPVEQQQQQQEQEQDGMVLPVANPHIQVVEVENGSLVHSVMPVESNTVTAEEQDASSALQSLQYSVSPQALDGKSSSAVSIIQQIIDMSQQVQGTLSNQQQITVQSEDGQGLVTINPETIIVQQEGEEVVVSSTSLDDQAATAGQYVIQYVTHDASTDEVSCEVLTSEVASAEGQGQVHVDVDLVQEGDDVAQEHPGGGGKDYDAVASVEMTPVDDPEGQGPMITGSAEDYEVITNTAYEESMDLEQLPDGQMSEPVMQQSVAAAAAAVDADRSDCLGGEEPVRDNRDTETVKQEMTDETSPEFEVVKQEMADETSPEFEVLPTTSSAVAVSSSMEQS